MRTKIDCCDGCTERNADPNCHGYCKEYLKQRAELDQSREVKNKKYKTAAGIVGQKYDCLQKLYRKRIYMSKYRKVR